MNIWEERQLEKISDEHCRCRSIWVIYVYVELFMYGGLEVIEEIDF